MTAVFNPIIRSLRPAWVLTILAICSTGWVFPASGDDYPELRELMQQNRLSDAGKRLKDLLQDNPNDPDLLFAQAVIADRSGDDNRAMELYSRLNRTHPELLEPYNNLAIHHARQGNYKAAVEVLEKALQANPTVATAYQNLTAIYAQLASAAYRKALNSDTPLEPLQLASLDQLEPLQGPVAEQTPALVASVENFVTNSLESSNQGATAVDDIVLAAVEPEVIGRTGADTSDASSRQTTPDSNAPTADATDSAPVVVSQAEPQPETKPEPTIAQQPEPPAPKPVVVAAVTPSAEAKQAVEEAAAQKQRLINRVKSWAEAWADRDVDRYLSHYSDSFIPRSGLALAEWRKQRYGRLRWRTFIEVNPSGFSVELDGDTAKVNFTQHYKSDRMEDTIAKTLVMKREGNRWLIIRELI